MTAQEQYSDLIKGAPPITVAGMTILGFPLSDWVLLLTALWTVLQIVVLVRRIIASRRSGADRRTDRPAGKKE